MSNSFILKEKGEKLSWQKGNEKAQFPVYLLVGNEHLESQRQKGELQKQREFRQQKVAGGINSEKCLASNKKGGLISALFH